MAITENKYTGDGSTVLYSFTFPYLEVTDIKVSLDGVDTTAYTLANATQIRFNTAPANGAAIRLYRQTDDENLAATFFPGSAIRAKDLNDNFTQNLYVTQESSRDAAQGIATADAATATANTALNNSSAAVSTANAASASAAAAVSTANTASSNASAAVSTANTASSNASAAVTTANSAATDAATAISTANGAVTTANSAAADAATAISTANTASSNASSAVSTANTASTNASNAVTTANTASTAASNAVTTANSAVTTANAAVVTANAADSKANQAIAAVAVALLFDIVPNVAAIPGSPQDGDAVEVTDATGIESFTPLSNLPAGFVGDAGLSARIIYNAGGATWSWLNYFANNPDDRYAGPNTDAGTAALPAIAFGPTDRDTGIYSPGAGQVAVATNGTGRLFVDASGRVGFGTSTFASDSRLEVKGATSSVVRIISANNSFGAITFGDTDDSSTGGIVYNHSDDSLALYGYDNTERLRITSAGLVGIGTSSPGTNLHIGSGSGVGLGVLLSRGVTTNFFEAHDGTKTFIGGTDNTNAFVKVGSLSNHPVAIVQGNTSAIYIDSSQRVGIGTTSPDRKLHVAGDWIRVDDGYGLDTSGGTEKVKLDNGYIALTTNNSERARIDSSGRLLVGTSSALETFSSAVIQAATAAGGTIVLGRNASSVTADQSLGGVYFNTYAGNAWNESATITCSADANQGVGDYPSRLVFSTTADGSNTPTPRMSIDSSGNVGINNSNPGSLLQITGSGYGANYLVVNANGTGSETLEVGVPSGGGNIQLTATHGAGGSNSAGFIFRTRNGPTAERMRLDASGRLLVGTSSATVSSTKLQVGSTSGTSNNVLLGNNGTESLVLYFAQTGLTTKSISCTTNDRINVFSNHDTSTGVYLTAGGTSWTSTSDERLKENLEPITDGLAKVSNLRCVVGNYINDPAKKRMPFLIAQDVGQVLPEAVDSTDPGELGLSYTGIIPLLVAALKESKERIEQLEATVTSLQQS